MTKDIYTEIDTLLDELGTAEDSRQELTQKVSDFEQELADLDGLAEEATSREEYERIITQREEATLDLRFARNRLRLFDQSPRIDPEAIADLLNQLSTVADDAAATFRRKAEKPLAEIVKAGDEFDATVNMVREAVHKLAVVIGPASNHSDIRRMFYRFELGTLRARAYCDGTIVHPDLRDALKLANTAKQPTFDTH